VGIQQNTGPEGKFLPEQEKNTLGFDVDSKATQSLMISARGKRQRKMASGVDRLRTDVRVRAQFDIVKRRVCAESPSLASKWKKGVKVSVGPQTPGINKKLFKFKTIES